MARRALAIAIVILALIAAGDSLLCRVCKPPTAGSHEAQREAEKMAANISRLFTSLAEDDIEECRSLTETEQFTQAQCPWTDHTAICLTISRDEWTARTCGRLDLEESMECKTCCGGATVCGCTSDLCNKDGQDAVAPTALLVVLLPAAVIAAAAGW